MTERPVQRLSRVLELVVASALGAGMALLLSFWLGGASADPKAPTSLAASEAAAGNPTSAESAIQELRAALQVEMVARENLETEVALMRAVLEQAALGLEGDGDWASELLARTDSASAPRKRSPFGDFDGDALEKEGLGGEQVQRVKGAWERHQLAQLELADLATREGWRGKARYQQEIQELRRDLRSELGDDGYDQMLYATGVPNRVVVQRVFPDSAASSAGLRVGDHVLSYDGQRVRNSGELRALTLLGQRGSSIRVQIFREGRSQTVSVPRGPVGINTRMESHPPASKD